MDQRGSNRRRPALAGAALIAAAGLGAPVGAEPLPAGLPEVTFPGMGIGAKFNEPQQPEADWHVGHGRANVFDRCYLPGDRVELRVPVTNPGEERQTLEGTWHWVWLGDAADGANGGVRLVPERLWRSEPLEPVALESGGESEASFAFDAPQRRGVLGLYLEAGEGDARTTRWVTNVAVFAEPAEGQRADSMFFGDLRGIREWQRALELGTMEKLGVKWVRVGESWGQLEPSRDEYRFEVLDGEIERVREHGMLAIYLGGVGADWTRAYGKLSWPRDNPQKSSASPDPSHYGEWAELFEHIAERWGDTVRAVNVFNEPWEMGGISNWGGTGAHYRMLQRMAHLGVQRGNPDVLVGGNDSDPNIVDNLFSDPAWRDYTDLLTVHGGEFTNRVVHRLAPDLPVWNTEHWYTSFGDHAVQWQLFDQLSGVEKSNLVVLGNFFTAGYASGGYYNPQERENAPDLIPQPNAAAYNAMTHVLEGMKLSDELAPDRLPYKGLFERHASGGPGADHGAVLMLVGNHIHPVRQLWWQLEPDADARLRLDPPEGVTAVLDRYGNPIEPGEDGAYTLPFDTRPTLAAAGSADSGGGSRLHAGDPGFA